MNVCITVEVDVDVDDWKLYEDGVCECTYVLVRVGDNVKVYAKCDKGAKKSSNILKTMLNNIADNGHPWNTPISYVNTDVYHSFVYTWARSTS